MTDDEINSKIDDMIKIAIELIEIYGAQYDVIKAPDRGPEPPPDAGGAAGAAVPMVI